MELRDVVRRFIPEQVVSFVELAQELGVRPEAVSRYHTIGLVGPDGERVKLKSVKAGGRTVTTPEMVADFLRAINGGSVPQTGLPELMAGGDA